MLEIKNLSKIYKGKGDSMVKALDDGLIVAGSFIIAILGTFIPVLIASKKAPIESIRTL